MMAAVLAGAFGILLASINTTLDPSSMVFLVVPALGAALLGRFSSFGLTVVAGLGIGMAQSWIELLGTKPWFPKADNSPLPGLKEALPFLVIVLALFLRGRTLPERGALASGRLPRATQQKHFATKVAVASIAAAIALFVLGPAWRVAIITSLTGSVICLSLVVLTGFVGQISLAQMAFAGVSGFGLSLLATDSGVPFPLAPLLGAGIATLFGLLTALPALRLRGVTLGVVTLAAALAIENFVFRNSEWSGGIEGAPVPPPRFLGFAFGSNELSSWGDGKVPNPWFGVFCLVVLVGLLLLVANLRKSSSGRRMLAVRSNERAAAGAGISVVGTKMLAFGFAAFVAGIGGALSGYSVGTVTPARFGLFASVAFLVFAYLGGIANVWGAVFGGMLVTGGLVSTALFEWFDVDTKYTLLVAGTAVILATIKSPEGIAGAGRVQISPRPDAAGAAPDAREIDPDAEAQRLPDSLHVATSVTRAKVEP